MKFSPIIYLIGMLLCILSLFMLIPAFVDWFYGNNDWPAFVGASLLTLFVGAILYLSNKDSTTEHLELRQAFLLTNSAWISIALFGSLPFLFSEIDMGFTDAIFESTSGITTTGATVINNLEATSHGILIWRALLQWLGGVGIIVMALAVLPMLSIGGMQLFKTESYETPDKVVPKAASFAAGISIVYITLTVVWALMLWVAGMPVFDSIAHAMTTLATGGYSTRSASLAAFNSSSIEIIIIFGMIVGSLPFVHYLAITKKGLKNLFKDDQVKLFLTLIVFVVLIVSIYLNLNDIPFIEALRLASFNVISIITGTGFGTSDFNNWGGFPTTILLILMFIGGCAGSTTCGLRMARIQVLVANAKAQISKLIRPHAVVVSYYNQKPIPENVAESVMGFFFLYIISFAVIACLLGGLGLDLITAISGAASAIGNVGPGLGDIIGPSGTYQSIPELGKLFLCAGMILGRLEIFAILVMFSPLFWKN
ncbi:TrkH family potassium uptake protein [Alphaproteobacteria bacterium]|nr:TrkH family potassium uptake protein [Alphaproteobacteria bacterium]